MVVVCVNKDRWVDMYLLNLFLYSFLYNMCKDIISLAKIINHNFACIYLPPRWTLPSKWDPRGQRRQCRVGLDLSSRTRKPSSLFPSHPCYSKRWRWRWNATVSCLYQCFSTGERGNFSHFVQNRNCINEFHISYKSPTLSATKESRNNQPCRLIVNHLKLWKSPTKFEKFMVGVKNFSLSLVGCHALSVENHWLISFV